MHALRVGFAGTPPFAARALGAILDAGFPVPLVLTQPDRPSGRGMTLTPSAVKALALARRVAVLQPPTLRTEEARAPVLAIPVDVLVVAAYGLILPPAVLDWPRHGGLNIHASLLPRWRGAAPIHHAILAGDGQTGVTIMQMDAGLDTGPMISTVATPIEATETTGSLTERLATLGAEAIVAALRDLERDGSLRSTPQPADGATYASKIDPSQAALDWNRAAADLDRQVRAFDPAPGARFTLANDAVKVWAAQAARGAGTPGTVLAVTPDALEIACGEGSLRLLTVQPPGGKRMAGGAFAAGRRLVPGARLA
ncbi:MAG: methionyl-tRNA formyltransferase [Burkholderiales bacterium]